MIESAVATGAPVTEPADVQPQADGAQEDREGLVLEDLLVEDVSIDGMCGVY